MSLDNYHLYTLENTRGLTSFLTNRHNKICAIPFDGYLLPANELRNQGILTPNTKVGVSSNSFGHFLTYPGFFVVKTAEEIEKETARQLQGGKKVRIYRLHDENGEKNIATDSNNLVFGFNRSDYLGSEAAFGLYDLVLNSFYPETLPQGTCAGVKTLGKFDETLFKGEITGVQEITYNEFQRYFRLQEDLTYEHKRRIKEITRPFREKRRKLLAEIDKREKLLEKLASDEAKEIDIQIGEAPSLSQVLMEELY